jgi:hypothetical protein
MASDESDTGDRIVAGRFRLGRMLGSGGMGTVHEAVDVAIGRPCALKVLRAGLASDPQQLQRFEREARAAARLSHPNVVGVTELVKDEAMGMALVMELLAGESLATRLERGPLGEPEAVHVFVQALDGLAAAHAAGMVHRDLKPSNLFLVPVAGGPLVKVLDFGIVKLAEEGALPKLTRKGALIGTPTYMSPEQLNCETVDARSDVYSMGACLYEALIARPPYTGAHSLELIAAVGAGPPRDLREIDRDVSPDLAHIARVAMSRDPSGRYRSAEAMREALRGAKVGARPPRKLEDRQTRAPEGKRRATSSASGTREALEVPVDRGPWRRMIVTSAVLSVVVAVAWWAIGTAEPAAPPAASARHAAPVRAAPDPAPRLLSPPRATPLVPDVPRGIDPPELAPTEPAPPEHGRPRRRGSVTPRSDEDRAEPRDDRSTDEAPSRGVGEVVLDPFAPRSPE